MVTTALSAVLEATGADRVHLHLDEGHAIGGRRAFYRNRGGERTPFRVSASLIERARNSARVVHVPVASRDPVASQFASVRREGISSSITLPLSALGRRFGVLHADCVRDGAVLTAEDLQRVA